MFSRLKARARRGREGGISLLEVMIAVAILTGLALSAALVLVPVSRQARINREVATANEEAKRVIEKVHAIPFSRVTTLYPNGVVIPVASLPNGRITPIYADPSADPLYMRTILTWDSPNLGPMMRTFFTVITR